MGMILDDVLDSIDWVEDTFHKSWRRAKRVLRGESGFSMLVMVLVIMALGAIILTPLLMLVNTGLRAGQLDQRAMQRFYAADAGIQDGMWRVANGDIPSDWKGTWDDSVYDGGPLEYTLPDRINGCDVTVTVWPMWLLAGLETPGHGREPHGELVTVSNVVSSGQGQVVIVCDSPGNFKLTRIGIWIPDGFTYTMGSSNIEELGHSDPAYDVPDVSEFRGGHTVIFDYGTAVDFDDFPGVTGNRMVVSFEYTGAGSMSSCWSWCRTNRHDIYLSWSSDMKLYQVSSTATDPQTGDDTTVIAGNMTNESVGTYLAYYGDYEVTGNALMRETDSDRVRDHLYEESPGQISVIPECATVRKLLLYWTGWKEDPEDVWDYDADELSELAEDSGVTQVSLRVELENGHSYDLGTVTAGEWTVLPNGSEHSPNGWSYACNCDITDLVVDRMADEAEDFVGNATYWVGHADLTSAPTATLRGVWGSNASNIFAVGDGGYIGFYDGSSWTPRTSGTTSDLYGVWGSSASNVFAVGEGGTILRYDGTSWSSMTSGTTNDLYGVWGSGASNVFAVGEGGTILRYNGTSWSAMTSGTTRDLYGVWGSSSSNVYAVGENGTIRRYNGSSWSNSSSGTTSDLYGVWGSSSSNIYAVGENGTIRRYNGSSWSNSSSGTSSDLYGVWGSSSSNIFAVGENGTIRRYTSSWGNSSSGTSSNLYGVWGSNSNNIYAVGASGTILRWNGSRWSASITATGLYGWVNSHSGESITATTESPLSDVVDNEWAYAAWSIITLYSSPVTLAHQMYLFDTFRYWNSNDDVTFTLDGFLAPAGIASEDEAVKITYFVGEGDSWYGSGDNFYLNGTQLNPSYITPSTAAANGNAMNSAGNSGGVTGYPPDDGIDLDTYVIDGSDGIIAPADSEATVRLKTGTDVWNMPYMILSFRSDIVGTGLLSYVVL